jgi:uncharacterized protein
MPDRYQVAITASEHVTAIAYPASAPNRAGICLMLAHGAGGDQTSSFMVRFAGDLAARGLDTITFNFLYSERRRGVPDRNDRLEACYRRVIDAYQDGLFERNVDCRKLAIGGKSMGGRIASQILAAGFDGIAGLVLLGYPLHPPGRPDELRSRHLPDIGVPMLFVQGSRDAFGTPDELAPMLKDLRAPAELCVVQGGDHSYKVPKRAGRTQEQVYQFVLDEVERWLRARSIL